ncbi:MAG: glutathione S-transferase family protein [Nannocystis sp.]|nr:glutathione S-transferase family protein [Nannocystis sp.]MBA3550253.1 glutathione S-transferase family protein [Nannocystis sp.]
MTLELYAHPLSSFCQKVLVALHENQTEFVFRTLQDPEVAAELRSMWPINRFPVLVDDGRMVVETSIIIEHLGLYHPGPVRLIPEDAGAALEVRMMDRFFDNYVSTPQQKIVFDQLHGEAQRDAFGVTQARAMLDTAYRWLDERMAGREWAAGERFSLADCAAAPALLYAQWTHPIDGSLGHLHAYRRRLLARPSYARAVDEARPYRPLSLFTIPEGE